MMNKTKILFLSLIVFSTPFLLESTPYPYKPLNNNQNTYVDSCEDETSEDNDSNDCECGYREREPFLWGTNEDSSEEGIRNTTWPGKREDSFYDSLTR